MELWSNHLATETFVALCESNNSQFSGSVWFSGIIWFKMLSYLLTGQLVLSYQDYCNYYLVLWKVAVLVFIYLPNIIYHALYCTVVLYMRHFMVSHLTILIHLGLPLIFNPTKRNWPAVYFNLPQRKHNFPMTSLEFTLSSFSFSYFILQRTKSLTYSRHPAVLFMWIHKLVLNKYLIHIKN